MLERRRPARRRPIRSPSRATPTLRGRRSTLDTPCRTRCASDRRPPDGRAARRRACGGSPRGCARPMPGPTSWAGRRWSPRAERSGPCEPSADASASTRRHVARAGRGARKLLRRAANDGPCRDRARRRLRRRPDVGRPTRRRSSSGRGSASISTNCTTSCGRTRSMHEIPIDGCGSALDMAVARRSARARSRRGRAGGDVVLADGTAVWIDGGPVRFVEPIDGMPVVHVVALEHGARRSRRATRRRPISHPTSSPRSPTPAARRGSSLPPGRARPVCSPNAPGTSSRSGTCRRRRSAWWRSTSGRRRRCASARPTCPGCRCAR